MTATPYPVALAGGVVLSDDRARIDMAVVHRVLAEAYWAIGRRPDLTERAFAHSLAFGLRAPGGATVGFGRIVTDYSFRAHLADIMVLPAARGQGLGKAMVAAMLAHPELATVEKWTLTTADAHGLYLPFGFRASPGDPNWMVRDRPSERAANGDDR